jgi:hypothetical protein
LPWEKIMRGLALEGTEFLGRGSVCAAGLALK